MLNKISISFVRAWEMLIDLSLPERLGELSDEEGGDNTLTLLFFPVVGAAIGLVFWGFARLLMIFPGNPSATIISSIAIVLALEIMNSGKSLSMMASFIELRYHEKLSLHDATLAMSDDFKVEKSTIEIVSIVSIFLLRLLLFGLIILAGAPFWIITVLTCSAAAQAYMVSSIDAETSEPFMEVDERLCFLPWLVAAVIVFVTGFSSPAAVFCALLVSILLSVISQKYCESRFGGVTAGIISVFAYKIEIIVLFIGIIFLFR